MKIQCVACDTAATLPLVQRGAGRLAAPCHETAVRPLPPLPVGTELHAAELGAVFRVVGRVWLPCAGHATASPLLLALRDVPAGELTLELHRQGRALAWITLSDKGFAGEREDTSGPAVAEMVRDSVPLCHEQGFLLPDDAAALRALLTELALGQGYDIICTSGGTGVGPRDVSPEATLAVLDKRLPGFEQAMMQAGLDKTPTASVSRAVAGVIGGCICINLPGSRKAVVENLAAVLPALGHALDKLHGDPADCGG